MILLLLFDVIKKGEFFMHNQKISLLSGFAAIVLAACGGATNSTTSSSSSASSVSSESSESTTDLPLANGVFGFHKSSTTEKAKILGALEKYAQDEFISGIPVMDNGANVLYSARLSIPSEVFIPGYGFGVGEGTINYPLTESQQPNLNYRSYFHTWSTAQVASLNPTNYEDAQQADYIGLLTSSYYSTRFTADKSNYEWYPSLATGFPIALNADSQGFATKWRIPLKVGGDLKYATLSNTDGIKEFNARPVALEDYLTPFKLMLDNQAFRANLLYQASSGFVGAKAYYDAKVAGTAADFSTVGIKLNSELNAIEFEFINEKNSFGALYNLSSFIWSPIPQSFITAVGGFANWGKVDSKLLDNVLSLGVYTLESWQNDKEMVFIKNPLSLEKDRYNFAGYYYSIIPGGAPVAFDEFLNGKIDSVAIPSTRLQQFKSDPRRRTTVGATTFKFNINGLTQQDWVSQFGVNGKIKSTPVVDYWNVKPIMSNKNFLNGIYFAIDRAEYAAAFGANPYSTFFSDAYMIDPENAISYRSTNEGKAAYEDRLPETFGFSEEIAKQFFEDAISELEVSNPSIYTPGTPAAPTPIIIDLLFQTSSQRDLHQSYLKSYVEDAFNAANPNYRLTLQTRVISEDFRDAYFKGMLVGQFDIAYGAISGNTLDPLDFMDTVRSDNKGQFTLNWTTDTSSPSQDLIYDGKAWSFDALQASSVGLTVVGDGKEQTLFQLNSSAQGTLPVSDKFTGTLSGRLVNSVPGVSVAIETVALYSNKTKDTVPGFEFTGASLDTILTLNPDGTFTITINNIPVLAEGYDIDVYYSTTINGTKTPGYMYRPIVVATA